jgi:hypothetical protein
MGHQLPHEITCPLRGFGGNMCGIRSGIRVHDGPSGYTGRRNNTEIPDRDQLEFCEVTMAALGIGLIIVGYGIAFNGYCLIKGYDLTLTQIWSPNWPILKTGAKQQTGG